MRRVFSLSALALALGLATAWSAPVREAHAAPQGISERAIDLDLKDADLKNVFALLSEVGGRPVVLDPCVRGAVDIKLTNTPVPIVFDALAAKLGLVYEEDAGDVLVRCAGDAGGADARLSSRVSVEARDGELRAALEKLVAEAKLDGIDYRASVQPKVTVTLERVRLSTAIAALADETGLKIAVARGQLVVAN
jgi:type II secretory pathway component GspD/PulD (secretin)